MLYLRYGERFTAIAVTFVLLAGCGLKQHPSESGDRSPVHELLVHHGADDPALAACLARIVAEEAARAAWKWTSIQTTTPVRLAGHRPAPVDSPRNSPEMPLRVGPTPVGRRSPGATTAPPATTPFPPTTPAGEPDTSGAGRVWRDIGRHAAARGATAIRNDPAEAFRFADLARAHHDLLETTAGRRAGPNPELLPALDARIDRSKFSLDRATRVRPDLEWLWIGRFLASLDRPPPPCRSRTRPI